MYRVLSAIVTGMAPRQKKDLIFTSQFLLGALLTNFFVESKVSVQDQKPSTHINSCNNTWENTWTIRGLAAQSLDTRLGQESPWIASIQTSCIIYIPSTGVI